MASPFVFFFLIGMLGLFPFPNLINHYFEEFSLTATLIIGLICLNKKRKKIKFALSAALLIILGLSYFSVCVQIRLKHQAIPNQYINTPVTVIGKIIGLPTSTVWGKRASQHFYFLTTKWCKKNSCRKQIKKLSLNWYTPDFPSKKTVTYKTSAQNNNRNYHFKHVLMSGESWQLLIKIKPIHGHINPGQVDQEKILFQKGIAATGYVINTKNKTPTNVLLANNPNLVDRINRLRQRYQAQIKVALKDTPFQGMIEALTIGVTNNISAQQWSVLRQTGTAHLFAISGLHIGMLALLFYGLFNYAWRKLPRLCLYLPAQKAATLMSTLSAGLYVIFSGVSLSAQRAWLILSIWSLSSLTNRYVKLNQRFALCLLLIIIIEPFSIMTMGFWLSFGAIAFIYYGLFQTLGPSHKLLRALQIQWAITVGLIPLNLLFFQQISIISLLANTLAIPWVSWLTVPFALLACLINPITPALAKWIFLISEKSIEYLWHFLSFLSRLPFSHLNLALYSPWLVIPILIATVLALAPIGFPYKPLAYCWFFSALALKNNTLPQKAVRLTVLDVGHGLASVVQTQNHTLIYDTGMRYPSGYNVGDNILIPFLQQQHIRHLDKIIISHGDIDHFGGAIALLKEWPKTPILTSAVEKFTDFQVSPCHSQISWFWDGVKFSVLYPFKTAPLKTSNAQSCILKITVGQQSILLPGDIEKPSEEQLIEHYHKHLKTTVLIAPHHGSDSSSSRKFVALTAPEIVVFSTDYWSQYHFPSSKVCRRYDNIGSKLFNVGQLGAVSITLSSNKKVTYQSFRLDHKRFWRANPSHF